MHHSPCIQQGRHFVPYDQGEKGNAPIRRMARQLEHGGRNLAGSTRGNHGIAAFDSSRQGGRRGERDLQAVKDCLGVRSSAQYPLTLRYTVFLNEKGGALCRK